MASIRNISIDKSANLQFDIAISDVNGNLIDLGLYSHAGSYKKHFESANAFAFSCNGFSNGTLRVELSGSDTANLEHGRYLYEVLITHTASNTTTKVQSGIMTVNGSAS